MGDMVVMDMVDMVMVVTMAKDLLMQSLALPPATLTEALKVCLAMADTVMADMAMVDMDMVVMVMVDITARDLLMLDTMEDTMVVLAPLFIRADPTSTDLTVMALTTMARGLLMLDTMDMETMVTELQEVSSVLTGHTQPMESMLLTPTKTALH